MLQRCLDVVVILHLEELVSNASRPQAPPIPLFVGWSPASAPRWQRRFSQARPMSYLPASQPAGRPRSVQLALGGPSAGAVCPSVDGGIGANEGFGWG